MAKTAKRPQPAELAEPRTRRDGAVPGRHGTRAEALELIFETAIRDGEGFRHGALGAPRFGKTYHMEEVVAESLDRGIAELVLIHDCKRLEVQYDDYPEGVRADCADLTGRPLGDEDEPVIVFHGDPTNNVKCRVEEVAALGLQQGRQGTATVVMIDELYHAMKARQTWTGPSFAECLREGSSQRVSTGWTTQIPQALPTEALDLTETIAIFKLKRRSLRYVVQMMELEPEAEKVIGRLERGEFILITDDGWNGVIYGPK
jgi:hypothetical protein